jgi:tetratricopeptide (TPR) repeat protein
MPGVGLLHDVCGHWDMLKKLSPALLLVLSVSLMPSISVRQVGAQESATADTYYNEGLESYGQGRYKEAIESFTQAIRLSGGLAVAARNPERRDAVIKLATAQSISGDHLSAMSTFLAVITNRQGDEAKRVISLDTESAQAYYDLGTAYYGSHGLARLGDFSMVAAIESFERAISLRPGYAEAYEYIGHSYNGLHKYKLSTEYYQRAIRLKPDAWMSYNGVGHNYAALHRYPEAIEFYRKARNAYRSTHGEEQAGVVESLAIAYLDSGDRKSAMEQYKLLKRVCAKSDCRGMAEELEYMLRDSRPRASRRKR